MMLSLKHTTEKRNIMPKPTPNCVICGELVEVKLTPEGKVYWNQGENAEPFAEGRCCLKCNSKFVIPSRFLENELTNRETDDANW